MPRETEAKRRIDQIVGARLEKLREGRGVDTKEIASLLGVTPGMIRLYERGKRGLSIAQAVGLAQYFHLGLEQFLFADEKPPIIVRLYKVEVRG